MADMAQVDPKLLEMAEVFHIPKSAQMKYIILPARIPALAKMLSKKGTSGQSKGGTQR
jgi:ABC-type nitrate/sulfonate/bicarbonate transport system permease component